MSELREILTSIERKLDKLETQISFIKEDLRDVNKIDGEGFGDAKGKAIERIESNIKYHLEDYSINTRRIWGRLISIHAEVKICFFILVMYVGCDLLPSMWDKINSDGMTLWSIIKFIGFIGFALFIFIRSVKEDNKD